jgi:hypothetical protein
VYFASQINRGNANETGVHGRVLTRVFGNGEANYRRVVEGQCAGDGCQGWRLRHALGAKVKVTATDATVARI